MIKSVCQICSIRFTVRTGSRGKACSATCGQKLAIVNRAETNRLKQETNKVNFVKSCKHCGIMINYENRTNIFCSSSCAATFNNINACPSRKRGPLKTTLTKPKRIPKNKVAKNKKIKKYNWKDYICGDYSKLYMCNCRTCNSKFVNRSPTTYCNNHRNMFKDLRSKYRFSFNIADHPTLFDYNLIRLYGWYSPGNRTPKNINGISRDHKISIADAIKYDYDPYYISHPVNCKLMRHNDNKSKYTKSSILYDDLIRQVARYDMAESCGPDPHPLTRANNLAGCV